MNTQALFLDQALHFDGEEKLAGTLTRMGDNVDLWPQEITQEAYKQLPYLSDFEPEVILDKVDEEKSFAFGSIEVRPKTAMTQEEQHSSPTKKMHIPIIIKEQMLSPFDVFMNGKKYEHLTEGRLRAALFRPETFDAPRDRPTEPSLIQQLQPPSQGGYGSTGAGIKLGAELQAIPLLPQLHGRVLEKHVERLKVAMAQDPSLRMQITNGDEGMQAAFNSAMQLLPSESVKTAELLADTIRPNVVQLKQQLDGNVLVKWANSDIYAPQSEAVPYDTAMDMLGNKDMVAQFEGDGTITASPDAAVKETSEAEEISVADKFGLYKVQDLQGNNMIGWVFPQLLSMDMQPLPLSLFNCGAAYAVQENIAGTMAGKSTDIPKGIPRGYGALYFIDHGTAKAFVPMTVKNTFRGPDGTVRYMAALDTGEEVSFSFAEGLKTITKVGQDQYVVPSLYNWMPLRGQTELVQSPSMFSKVATQKIGMLTTAEILGDGGVYSFRGPAVAKLAAAHTKFINRDDAEFLGVALGMSPPFCKEALDKASKGELIPLHGLRPITPAHEKMAAAREKVRQELDDLPVPIRNYFLVKEASVLDDALTADKILGLGFVNAENVSTFVDMIPTLEDTSSKLAELLVFIRLGEKNVPEVAVERMLVALEDVIRGLKALRQKESGFTE